MAPLQIGADLLVFLGEFVATVRRHGRARVSVQPLPMPLAHTHTSEDPCGSSCTYCGDSRRAKSLFVCRVLAEGVLLGSMALSFAHVGVCRRYTETKLDCWSQDKWEGHFKVRYSPVAQTPNTSPKVKLSPPLHCDPVGALPVPLRSHLR